MSGQEYRDVFSKKLRFYMELNCKTQADLIRELNYSRSAVSTWCLGTRIPRPEIIDQLADYFGIRRSDLLEYKKEDDNEHKAVSIEGQRLLKVYNNNSRLKILFDKQLDLSEKQAQMLIDIVEEMTKHTS